MLFLFAKQGGGCIMGDIPDEFLKEKNIEPSLSLQHTHTEFRRVIFKSLPNSYSEPL